MLHDIKYALRQLRRNPGFAIGVVTILAFAIGANTAEFSVTHAILLKPLPFSHSDQLVWVNSAHPEQGLPEAGVSVPVYLERRAQINAFADSTLFNFVSFNLSRSGLAEQIDGLRVTPSFFSTLGVIPWKGRAFTAGEATPGREKVAILGYPLWQSLFGSDEAVLGHDIRLNGENYRVIGIMSKGSAFGDDRIKICVPFAFTGQQMSEGERSHEYSSMIARLRPDATIEQARQEIDALQRRDAQRGVVGTVVGLHEYEVRKFRPMLLILQAAAALILLIACANVANLLLVRATARRQELAIRLALGSGHFRLARQLLAESLVLVFAGGISGVLLSVGVLPLLRLLGGDTLPNPQAISIDWTVLGFTLLLVLGSSLFFALVPLISIWRYNPAEELRGGIARGSAGRSGGLTRGALIAAEVGLALMLLIAAGLTLKSFLKLQDVRPGFTSDNVLTCSLSPPPGIYKDGVAQNALCTEILRRLRALPGVRSASAISTLPFNGWETSSYSIKGYTPKKRGEGLNGRMEIIDPAYFQTMEIPLLRGRVFSGADTNSAAPVVIIDQFLAHHYFAGRDPIGQQIKSLSYNRSRTIIGVVGEVKSDSLVEPVAKETLYFPLAQTGSERMTLVIKTDAAPRTLVTPLREAVAQIDPELAVYDVRTLDQRLADSLVTYRSPTILLTFFGATALVLAALGLYGVLAYSVSQRTREIGIRMALGAQNRAILTMVVGQGLRLTLLGIVFGLGASFALNRFLRSLLFGVSASDPLTYVIIPTALMIVAVLACWLPARRATRVDPAVTLRAE